MRDYWQHRHLLLRLVARDLAARYRGSLGGLFWAWGQPALMLLIYALVFGHVFVQRGTKSTDTALIFSLFLGLILHGVLADTLARAPQAIIAQPSYVKKVVFPLALLPMVVVCSALVQSLLAGGLLFVALLVFADLPMTAWLWPLAWIPLLLLSCGVALCFAALTVYLRDLAQISGLLSTALLFLGPVFFRFDELSPTLQKWLILNPLTVPIETARSLILAGHMPAWRPWWLHLFASLVIVMLGAWVFTRTRRGFADVL